MNKIELVFCFDDNYCEHFFVTSISILENISDNSKNRGLIYHIIYDKLSEENMSNIADFFKKNDFLEINFYKINNDDLKALNFQNLSVDAFVKIKIPEIIKSSKILYLDVDLVINGDIAELYDKEIDIFGAVMDPNIYLKKYFDFLFKPEIDITYFNAGVMLMNLDKMREMKSFQIILDFLIENKNRHLWLDQGGFNYLFYDKYTLFPIKYNFIPSVTVLKNTFSIFDKAELKEAKESPFIVHFAGGSMYKPWFFESVGVFRNYYFKYHKMSPYDKKKFKSKKYLKKFVNIVVLYLLPNFIIKVIYNRNGEKFLERELVLK